MQSSLENTGALERKLTVQVPADQIDGKIQSKLRELSRQVRIKGFRPGRIPMKVMQQRYGKQVRMDVIGEVLQQSLQEAMLENDVRPVAMPQVSPKEESLVKGDLEYTATFEVFPDIGDTDVTKLEIERPVAEVSDADIDKMLMTLRQQRAEWTDSEKSAAEGDRVEIEYFAEGKVGRHPVEGSERAVTIIGSETLFPAFEKALEGKKAGASKKFKLKFPDGFRDSVIGGKSAQVSAEILTVKTANLPEIDEDFIRSFGLQSGDIEQLRVEVRENLERELKSATMSLLKVGVLDRLLEEKADIDVPEALIREEAENMSKQVVARQQQSGIENPKPMPWENFADAARKRVVAGMVMAGLASSNSLVADKDRIRAKIETIAATYEQQQQVMELYFSNRELMQGIESAVLEEQVVEWILENAIVNDKKMTFNEVIQRAANL